MAHFLNTTDPEFESRFRTLLSLKARGRAGRE